MLERSDVFSDSVLSPYHFGGMAQRKPRLGFAGVGRIGRMRMESLIAAVPVDVIAIADPSLGLASTVAAEALQTDVCCTETFEDLLSLDLDGIVVATPSALHAEQAIAALENGMAVFCQKPLARTAVETDAVVEAARRANRLLAVDLSYRFTTGMQAIRAAIRAGELGQVYAIEAVFHNAYGPDKAWFYDVKSAGGGCLLDLGIHLVDLALWALDFPPVEGAHGIVRARHGLGFRRGDGVEDYATGQVEFAGGAVLQLACSWHAPAGCDARIELVFLGTKGGASFRNVNGSFFDFVTERFHADRSRHVIAGSPEAWSGRAVIEWAQRLTYSSAFNPEVQHLTSVARVLDALYQRSS